MLYAWNRREKHFLCKTLSCGMFVYFYIIITLYRKKDRKKGKERKKALKELGDTAVVKMLARQAKGPCFKSPALHEAGCSIAGACHPSPSPER